MSCSLPKSISQKSGACSEYWLSSNRDMIWVEINDLQFLVQMNWWIMTLAHPQVTFKDIEHFLELFPIYHDEHWVRAIEIPTSANLEWTQAILKIAKDYNCIVTFWSDSHGYKPDSSHWDFLTMNSFIEQKYVNYKTDEFIEIFN